MHGPPDEHGSLPLGGGARKLFPSSRPTRLVKSECDRSHCSARKPPRREASEPDDPAVEPDGRRDRLPRPRPPDPRRRAGNRCHAERRAKRAARCPARGDAGNPGPAVHRSGAPPLCGAIPGAAGHRAARRPTHEPRRGGHRRCGAERPVERLDADRPPRVRGDMGHLRVARLPGVARRAEDTGRARRPQLPGPLRGLARAGLRLGVREGWGARRAPTRGSAHREQRRGDGRRGRERRRHRADPRHVRESLGRVRRPAADPRRLAEHRRLSDLGRLSTGPPPLGEGARVRGFRRRALPEGAQTLAARLPRRLLRDHQARDLVPGMRARPGQVLVGRVGEHDGLQPLRTQPRDVLGRVLQVEIGTHGRLLAHEAQVPVRDIVQVEPLDRLAHRDLVEVLDEQSVRDDADAHILRGEPAQRLRCAGHRRQPAKQLALRHRKAVQRVVAAGRLVHAPLGERPRDAVGEARDVDAEPLGRDRLQPAVEVGADAVEVDAEDEAAVARHRLCALCLRLLFGLELQRLQLEELLQPEFAELAAVPRLLEPAEGRKHVERAAVDVHLTRAQAPRHLQRVLLGRRPHPAAQAVGRVVRDADRVGLVLVGDDREHWAEDLLLRDGRARFHLAEHRRLHVVALVEPRRRIRPAGEQLGAFLDALADVAAHALALRRGGKRPESRLLVHGVAERELLRLLGRKPRGFGVLRLRHEHARVRAARLARIEEARGHRALHRRREVGVVEHDGGALAAELERDALDRRRGELGHALAGARGAGERHHVDVGMLRQRLADHRAEAGHEVEHALRQPDRVDDLRQDESVQRSDLGRLQYDRAAGGEGRRDLRGDLVQRIVPRRDARDDADRLAHHDRVADFLLPLVPAEHLCVHAEGERGRAGLDARRQLHRHADFLRDRPADLVRAGLHALVDLREKGRAIRRRSRGPAFERGARSGNRGARVALIACGDLRYHLLGRGGMNVDRAFAVRRGPRAVDVELVAELHRKPRRGERAMEEGRRGAYYTEACTFSVYSRSRSR